MESALALACSKYSDWSNCLKVLTQGQEWVLTSSQLLDVLWEVEIYPVIAAHHDAFIWGWSLFCLLVSSVNRSVLVHIVSCIFSLHNQYGKLVSGPRLQQLLLFTTAKHLLPRIMHG